MDRLDVAEPGEHAAGTLRLPRLLAPRNATTIEAVQRTHDAFSACTSQLYRYQVVVDARRHGGAAPRRCRDHGRDALWITRRRKLQPLTAADAPAVVEEVAELAREQELDPPRLFWNPLDASAGGLAFGHPGRYSVAIGGGLVVKQVADPPAFRAVVRHELAHIRNRDVGITYFTLAVWYAFLLVAVVPFIVTLLGDALLPNVMWRLAVLALLVYLTRNAVLRSREVYADLRASVPDGPGGALRRVLAALPRPKTDPLTGVRSAHPDPARRLAALDDTRPLFPLGAVVAFAAGLTATIAFDSVKQLLSSFVSATRSTCSSSPGSSSCRSPQASSASRSGGRPLQPTRTAASPRRPGSTPSRSPPGSRSARSSRSSGSSPRRARFCGSSTASTASSGPAVLVAGLVLIVAWIRTSASWWLRALGGRRPLLAQTAGLLIGGVALTAFTAVFYDRPRDYGPASRSRARRPRSSTSRSTPGLGRAGAWSGSS